jgi:hypothetical protein
MPTEIITQRPIQHSSGLIDRLDDRLTQKRPLNLNH